MPILKTQRTYPLALTADSINTGVVASFEVLTDKLDVVTFNASGNIIQV